MKIVQGFLLFSNNIGHTCIIVKLKEIFLKEAVHQFLPDFFHLEEMKDYFVLSIQMLYDEYKELAADVEPFSSLYLSRVWERESSEVSKQCISM